MERHYEEWCAYAKRTGVFDENGAATDRRAAQTSFNAFAAAWNACARIYATARKVVHSELTNEGILHLWDTHVGDPTADRPLTDADKIAFARAIQAQL